MYQTLNPEYHRWAEDFPPLQRSVLAAAEANGARFVNMDNVYSYGRPGGQPLTEESPQEPHTRKGRVRLDMADELWAAHRAGRVEVVSGRASDYYGPGAGVASPLGDRVLGPVVAGKRVSLFGDPGLVHSYTYLPDIGEGLAVLGTRARGHGVGMAPAERSRAVDEPRHGRGALPARGHHGRASAACRRSRCGPSGS